MSHVWNDIPESNWPVSACDKCGLRRSFVDPEDPDPSYWRPAQSPHEPNQAGTAPTLDPLPCVDDE